MKKTVNPVDSSEAVESALDTRVSFEFGLSRVTSTYLDEFSRVGWFPHKLVRLSEGEVVVDPQATRLLCSRSFL